MIFDKKLMSNRDVYMDISDLYKIKAKTGIQRAVREIAVRLNRDERSNFKLNLVSFNTKTHKYDLFDSSSVEDFLLMRKDDMKIKESISIDDMKRGSIFFDLDSAWNVDLKRSYLYKKLKELDVHIISFIYDLIPIVHPEFVHVNTLRNHVAFVAAVYTYADLVMFDSRCAEKDFINYKKRFDVKRDIPTLVTKIGVDFSIGHDKVSKEELKLVEPFINDKYLLFVGTIEPRKKHRLAMDAMIEVFKKHPDVHLVFAGKKGWKSDKFFDRMTKNHWYGKRMHWVDTPSDALLSKLYEECFIGLYLSTYEGFGLPIGESLGYDKITIASKDSSMYEVGGMFADYVVYNTKEELSEIVDMYVSNETIYKKRTEYIKEKYKPYTWDNTYEVIFQAMSRIGSVEKVKKGKRSSKLQAVTISNNLAKLTANMKRVNKRMPFIDKYLVVSPGYMVEDVNKISEEVSMEVVCVDEKDILGDKFDLFKSSDHLTKNWMLRSRIVKIPELCEEFVMLDDDNRPIVDLDIDTFINEDKTYNAYYFHDLPMWLHKTSSYDRGQIPTMNLLNESSMELLMYSAHQPQIINKSIFTEMLDYFGEDIRCECLDEWNLYFNYAITRYPELFNKQIFNALNWPAEPSNWQNPYYPEKILFENYYDDLYTKKKGIFYDVDEDDTEKKIELKNEQMEVFNRAIRFNDDSKKIISECNTAHGVLEFKLGVNKYLYLHNVPYFVATGKKACVRLNFSYQLIGKDLLLDDIALFCEAKGTSASRCNLAPEKVGEDYYVEAISFPFLSRGRVGSYDIDFWISYNGQRIYDNNRSISNLLVVDDNDAVEDAIEKYI